MIKNVGLIAALFVAGCGSGNKTSDPVADQLENAADQSDQISANVLENAADAIREGSVDNASAVAANAMSEAGNASKPSGLSSTTQAKPHEAGEKMPPEQIGTSDSSSHRP